MLQVAVCPLVVGCGEEHIVFQAIRRVHAQLQNLRHIVVAQVDGAVAHCAKLVVLRHASDAHAQHGQVEVVGIVAPQRLAEDLRRAVNAFRSDHFVRNGREVGRHIIVVAIRDGLVRLDEFVAANGVAAAGEHCALDARKPRSLEYIVGSDDVAAQLPLEVVTAEIRRQMYDDILALARRLDRIEVGYVCLIAFHAFDRAAIQRAEFVAASRFEPITQQPAYESAHSGNQYLCHVLS